MAFDSRKKSLYILNQFLSLITTLAEYPKSILGFEIELTGTEKYLLGLKMERRGTKSQYLR